MPLVEGRDAQNNETADYHSSAREGSREPISPPPEIDDSESKDWLGSDKVLSISLIYNIFALGCTLWRGGSPSLVLSYSPVLRLYSIQYELRARATLGYLEKCPAT